MEALCLATREVSPVKERRGGIEEIQMTRLPMHSGRRRRGSLRVTAQCDRGTEPRLELYNDYGSRLVWLVHPASQVGVSVVRHDMVFDVGAYQASLSPCPVCPCCPQPAEVYDLRKDPTNPLHVYLKGVGFYSPCFDSGPLFLRVCRQGCLTYESDN